MKKLVALVGVLALVASAQEQPQLHITTDSGMARVSWLADFGNWTLESNNGSGWGSVRFVSNKALTPTNVVVSVPMSKFQTFRIKGPLPVIFYTALSYGQEGGFDVPVKVVGFTNIASFTFTLRWDRGLTYLGLSSPDWVGGTFPVSGNTMTVTWTNNAMVTLPDDSTLFTLHFQVDIPGLDTVQIDPVEPFYVFGPITAPRQRYSYYQVIP